MKKPSSTASASAKASTPLAKIGGNKSFKLDPEYLVKIFDTMLQARLLEERLIKMYKQSHGYFWIGGPGEEAFSVPLGLHVKKGYGKAFDFLHLHYRSSPILTAMGLDPADAMRQMKNTATDPFSGGRNFGNHFAIKDWNVVPVSSTIETQYLSAIGTGISHKQHGGDGITIVNGGDAGTAEGDFASCLVWSSRPNFELPILMIVTNNQWGISTAACTQHGEKNIADRATAFQIPHKTFNGNDVEESVFAIREAMDYVRTERKPYMLEARVSRLYGHSSASGANFVKEELDCLQEFEKQLHQAGILSPDETSQLKDKYETHFFELAQKVIEEPMPSPDSIYDHVYFGQKGKYW